MSPPDSPGSGESFPQLNYEMGSRISKILKNYVLHSAFLLFLAVTAEAVSPLTIRYPSKDGAFRVISSEIKGLSQDTRYDNPRIALTDIPNYQSLKRDSTSEMLENALNESLSNEMPDQVVPHFELIQLRIEWNENYPGSFREPLSEDLAGQAEADWMISGTHETLENQELQLRLELYDMVSEKILWQSNVTFPQAGILFLEQSVAPVSPPQKPSISEKKNPPEFQDRFDELSPNAGIKDPLQYKSDHEIKNQPSFEQNQRGFFSMILPEFISPPPLPPPPEGMVRIPEGEFVMGNLGGRTDEQPDHLVFIKSFFMDEHEVTNSDYLLCEKCERGHGGFDTHSPDQPVVYVDWHNANQYCLSQGKRLPSEAEWEYTAKAGNINRDPKRIDSENLTLVAWFEENTVNLGLYGPQKVASKKPSAWGLYDMRGNVMEWVSDFYLPEYNAPFHKAVSPKGPETASNPEYPLRVVRGGAWGGENGAASRDGLRPSRRYAFAPWVRSFQIGFRCAADEQPRK